MRDLRHRQEHAQSYAERRVPPGTDSYDRHADSESLPVESLHSVGVVVVLKHLALAADVPAFVCSVVINSAEQISDDVCEQNFY